MGKRMNLLQKLCIMMGLILFFVSIVGKQRFHFPHSLLIFFTSSLTLWAATFVEQYRIYSLSLGIGIVFLLLSLGGFVLGTPGLSTVHPGVEYSLFKVIPGVLEFGKREHILHLIIALSFFGLSLIAKRRIDHLSRFIVEVQSSRAGPI